MFYYLTQLRDVYFVFNIFKYITFRAAAAALTTFLICIILGPVFIRLLKEWKFREVGQRQYCGDLQQFLASKQGTPTMGGIFMIGSIVISVLLWADLSNRFIILTLLTCIYLATLGFVDDYIKLTSKDPKKRGLRVKTKFLWEILLGCFVGSYLYFCPETNTHLDVPFFKNVALTLGIFYIPFIAMVIIGATNAVNLTDGLDGLAIGCALIVSATLAILSYISGNIKFSEYLFIPFIPGSGELTVFCAAILGAGLGFLWFNSHPATVFMGDVGSLALGGTIGVIAVFIKKELLLGLLGGVFVLEAGSVILQVTWYKLFKKRIFKMSPFHHHLQLSGWPESKIITRLWIVGIILALLTLATLKIR